MKRDKERVSGLFGETQWKQMKENFDKEDCEMDNVQKRGRHEAVLATSSLSSSKSDLLNTRGHRLSLIAGYGRTEDVLQSPEAAQWSSCCALDFL